MALMISPERGSPEAPEHLSGSSKEDCSLLQQMAAAVRPWGEATVALEVSSLQIKLSYPSFSSLKGLPPPCGREYFHSKERTHS